jgi:hypothetical protein
MRCFTSFLVAAAFLKVSACAFADEPAAKPTLFVAATIPPTPGDVALGIGSSSKEAFVLPIHEGGEVLEARRIIKEGPRRDQVGVFVRIEGGADGVNRNYAAPGAPLWNWHVTVFHGFASGVVMAGNAGFYGRDPSWLEENLSLVLEGDQYYGPGGWVALKYMVVAELNPELSLQLAVDGADVLLQWEHQGPYYVFTVEFRDSLTLGEWRPVPGTVWPSQETSWRGNGELNAIGARFYRVRAELKLP